MTTPVRIETENPDLVAGIVEARGLRIADAPPKLVAGIDLLLEKRAESGFPPDDLRKAIRDLFRFGGFKPTGRSKPASEYLARTAEGGSFPRINNVVDACNFYSLLTGLPISLLDLDLAMAGTEARGACPSNPAAPAKAREVEQDQRGPPRPVGPSAALARLTDATASTHLPSTTADPTGHARHPRGYSDRLLVLREGAPDERYVFNPAGHEIDVSGLLCVARADGPALGNAVKDSMETKTHAGTTNVLAVIYGSRRVGPAEVIERMAARLGELLEEHAGASSVETWALPEPDGTWIDGLG